MKIKKKKPIIITLLILVGILSLAIVFIFQKSFFFNLVVKTKNRFNIHNTFTIEIIDNNPRIYLALASNEKLKDLAKFFPKLFELKKIAKIRINLTTEAKQYRNKVWNKLTFFGYSTNTQEDTVVIDFYLEPVALKQAGFSENSLAQYIELMFIEALYNEQSALFPTLQTDYMSGSFLQRTTSQAKKTQEEINALNSSQLFLASYE